MKCPRCDFEGVSVIAKSPIEGVWEVYECDQCYFSWRSTEDIDVHDVFKLTKEKIDGLQIIPPIPPLEV
ncbi:MAG: vanillic acid non-oxidative decarboxylation protein [Atopobiaceae bacterium]|nr:vanillic acid non-oxidative decarboxylation protein [Atopobiaceae bacterium]MBQ3282911.1 vanillic acid non-oxidative decarboxylation protein [Atopobiaceae bacterium]MBQ6410497.1 vanillic acid non-oxidative decarboxylation protein [Atopobiaceae bacterium]MBQ6650542.1 vanillic acid non-oxidative decarboxylation protein [Atopobiaceae bacterium]MBR3384008.1 vanillic acid non-oxidative decarboxylation protein [Atopobiaceae bacterium]